MDNIYKFLASYYDQIMPDSFYLSYSKFIENMVEAHNLKTDRVLDIACGTGSLLRLLEFQHKIGVDISLEMLEIAKNKFSDNFVGIHSNMLDFKVDEKFDLILCTNDSLNYLLSIDDIKAFFSKIELLLNTGGLFILDINTMFFYTKMTSQTLLKEYKMDDSYLYWKDIFLENSNNIELTLFKEADSQNNLYSMHKEIHQQKGYEEAEIISSLKECLKYSKMQLFNSSFKEVSDFSNSSKVVLVLQK